MKTEPGPRDLLVAFLLVRNALDRRSDGFFQSFGLTGAQFNILNLLALSKSPLDQLTLTERLLVGKSSISIVLNRMVKAGLIKRQEHSRDRRQVVLTLTRQGLALWQKTSPRYKAGVREIFGSLPKKCRRPFLDNLETLTARLDKTPNLNPKTRLP